MLYPNLTLVVNTFFTLLQLGRKRASQEQQRIFNAKRDACQQLLRTRVQALITILQKATNIRHFEQSNCSK